MLCFRLSQLPVSHMCKRIFKFELQLCSYRQNIKLARYCPKFHIFTKIVIFQVQKVYLHLFRPNASIPEILWQGHIRNTLFHFCQLWAVNKHTIQTILLGCFTKLLLMKIFRVVITSLPISIPQWNIGQNSMFNKTIKTNKQTKQKTFLTKNVTNIEFFYGFF